MTLTDNTVRLSEIIAPSFYDLHRSIKRNEFTHYWLSGGRGSCKSSFVSVEIISGIMKNPDSNAIVLRKVGLYLKDSVYSQLQWAIDKLGVSEYWQEKLSPLELIYKPTGQRILFRGADKPQKLKSAKVNKGYIRYIWYEEADEFAGIEEIRTINQSFMRGGDIFTVFYSYNPPKSVANWINRYVKTGNGKTCHHSTYLTVPKDWLGEQFIAEAKQLKADNPTAYEHEYMGKATGTGGEVFANITQRQISDSEIAGFQYIYRGLDWGYGADPFAYVALGYDSKFKVIFIYYEFYKFGASYDSIAKGIQAENSSGRTITAESAEPRSNQEMRERGINILAAKKGPGSVEHGITRLQELTEIVIDPVRCPNVAREFTQYTLIPDGNGGYREGFPDKDNHTIDAVRYALESVFGRRKIKIHKEL